MGAIELRAALASLGLSQTAASKFLNVNERTVRRWCLGSVPVPTSTALLLRLAQVSPLTINEITSLPSSS